MFLSYLVNDILFSRSPQQLSNDIVQWLCVSTPIRTIEQLVPPVFDPIWVNSQEKNQTIQICTENKIRLNTHIMLYMPE